LVLYWNRKNV